MSNLTVGKQFFFQALKVKYVIPHADGILGLAWPSLAPNGTTPVFQQMLADGIIENPVFGFYLNR